MPFVHEINLSNNNIANRWELNLNWTQFDQAESGIVFNGDDSVILSKSTMDLADRLNKPGALHTLFQTAGKSSALGR